MGLFMLSAENAGHKFKLIHRGANRLWVPTTEDLNGYLLGPIFSIEEWNEEAGHIDWPIGNILEVTDTTVYLYYK